MDSQQRDLSGIARLLAATGSLLLTGMAAAGEVARLPDQAPAEAPLEILDEILVSGEHPGPALWQVRSGSNVLWILAEIRLVPGKLKWRSKQVEKVLADAVEVLVTDGSEPPPRTPEEKAARIQRVENQKAFSARRLLPDGKKLSDVLTPEIYTRYQAAIVAFAGNERDAHLLNPPHAAWRLTNGSARALKLGLSPVSEKVIDMAKRRKIKVTRVEPYVWSGAETLAEEDFMDTCALEDRLDDLDDGAARLKARINAWSVGDVNRLKGLVRLSARPATEGSSGCLARVEGSAAWLRGRTDSARHLKVWLDAAERVLASHDSTLAVLDISDVLSPGGVLEALRSRGYEVVEPS